MSSFSGSPRLIKGGIALIDPTTSAVRRVIPLQYNPDSLSRTLQVQAAGAEGGDRSDALRLKGPAVETIKVEAELDATDAMEQGDPAVAEFGLFPLLAELETLVYPESRKLAENDRLAASGALEVLPIETPLSLFIWSKNRILPVRITDLSVTEEAFDPDLNPIRAKVSLSLRVLSVMDLGFAHRGGRLFMVALERKEQLAARNVSRDLNRLGIGGLP